MNNDCNLPELSTTSKQRDPMLKCAVFFDFWPNNVHWFEYTWRRNFLMYFSQCLQVVQSSIMTKVGRDKWLKIQVQKIRLIESAGLTCYLH